MNRKGEEEMKKCSGSVKSAKSRLSDPYTEEDFKEAIIEDFKKIWRRGRDLSSENANIFQDWLSLISFDDNNFYSKLEVLLFSQHIFSYCIPYDPYLSSKHRVMEILFKSFH